MKSRMIIGFFTLLLILEGFGIDWIRTNIIYIYCLAGAIIYLDFLLKKKKILFPEKLSLIYSLFVLFSLTSSLFFSVDKRISFELILFYLSAYLIFIFAYSNKKLGEKIIWWQLIAGTIFFIGYNLFKFPYHPTDLQNFIFPISSNHNHLGDFLGLVIVYLVYNRRYFSSLLLTPFLLFSSSRSAFLSLFLTLFFLFKNNRINKILLVIISVILLYSFLPNIKSRGINSHVEYVQQAFLAFQEKPFFGYGPGNFYYLSTKYRSNVIFGTDNAHNIFLDVLTENGLFAFLAFLIFIILIFRSGFKKKNRYFFLFLYLLLNFQTDYTYKIYSFFILFMIISAVNYQEKKNLSGNIFYGFVSILLLLIVNFVLLKAIIGKKNIKISSQHEYNYYQWLAPYNLSVIDASYQYWYEQGNKKVALDILERAFENNRYLPFNLLEKLYFLKKELAPINESKRFLGEIIDNCKYIPWLKNSDLLGNPTFIKICNDAGNDYCKQLWKGN